MQHSLAAEATGALPSREGSFRKPAGGGEPGCWPGCLLPQAKPAVLGMQAKDTHEPAKSITDGVLSLCKLQ